MFMFKFGKNKNQKGFSLPEMLIVFAILSIVLSAIVGYFVSVLKTQSYILASQQLQDQTSYALDYMYKMVRMAKKDSAIVTPENPFNVATCVDDKYNFSPVNPSGAGSSSLQFVRIERQGSGTNQRVCQNFSLVSDAIISTKDGVASQLTSDNVRITKLAFVVSGDGGTEVNDKYQPKITILIEAESKNLPNVKIHLQTTASQRDLDVDL
jgi:prepilin-type N-terminal cleavage/methylation domain-containing protein